MGIKKKSNNKSKLVGLLFTILAGLFWQKGDFIVDMVAPLLENQLEFLQEKIYI